MAQLSIVKKASVVVMMALVAATTVSAQEMSFAPAPGPMAEAPGPMVGAAFSVPASGVMIGTSLLVSFVALFRN